MPLKERPIVYDKPDNVNLKKKYNNAVHFNFFKQRTYLEEKNTTNDKKPQPIINNSSSMYIQNKQKPKSGKVFKEKQNLFMKLNIAKESVQVAPPVQMDQGQDDDFDGIAVVAV